MTLYAKIKSGTVPEYLTAGKEYRVTERYGRFLKLHTKPVVLTTEFNSGHLSGGDWELIEKPEAKE